MKPISLALLLLFSFGIAGAAQAATRKADARQLLRLAESGLANSVKAAEASQGRIARTRPEQRPFWQAVDKMHAVIGQVRAGMLARDESFFRALENGSTALGELRVVWARTGVPDPGVAEGIRILSESYQLLRVGYGREAVRHRKGCGLTEAERQRFLRIQLAEQRFADLLKELQERAQKKGDEAMLAELRRMAAEAERIANAQLTLEAYLNALMIADAQQGEMTGNTQYAAPEERPEYQEAETVVEEIYTEEEIGEVFVLDLGNLNAPAEAAAPLTLTHFEEATDLPDSLAAAAAEAYEAPAIDAVEEEESLFEEEMEETADTDVEVYEEVVEEPKDETAEATEEEVALKEGTEEDIDAAEKAVVEELPVELPVEKKAEEKAVEKPADPKKKDAAPAPAKKDPAPAPKNKKKRASPPAPGVETPG